FKVGVNNLDFQNNVLVNELYKYSYNTLINITDEYGIEYNIAKNIIKIDELNYKIEIKDNDYISDIVYTFEKLKSTNNNRYYKYLSNITNIKINENNILITLTIPNEYIVYAFDFKIEEKNKSIEKQNNTNRYFVTSLQNTIKFNRNESLNKNILKSITLNNYTDSDEIVNDFRTNKIDAFMTSSEEDVRLIGKHEYNIKKYRDGETYFLFGNKNSELFKLKEVRKAFAYSLNRNEICKKISSSFTEVIDIPYIYSDIKYKYDIYGAENSLIAESWNKSSGIYTKKINGVNKILSLNLLVNIDDINKVLIADNIKLMLENIGIKINIIKIKQNELIEKVKLGEYDLTLSTVNINNNPDTTYLKDYININKVTDEAFNKVKTSDVNNLSSNIQNLQNVLSSEIACIGIAAKNTNFIYQKYIEGFNDIKYMNIFKNIDKIGKIVK
ncbi:MAG: ABC transporter substrate-binding protein, partial [Clostridia bacterium]